MNSSNHDIEAIITEINDLLDEGESVVSNKLFGDVYRLNYGTGYAKGLLESLSPELLPTDHANYIENTRLRISNLEDRSADISATYNPAEIIRRAQAETTFQRYSALSSTGFSNSSKYLLIASGTALISGLSAIVQGWEHGELVSVVLKAMIAFFIPALCVGIILDGLNKVANAKYAEIWQNLSLIHPSSNLPSTDNQQRYASIAHNIFSVFIGIGLMLISCGALYIARELMYLKLRTPPSVMDALNLLTSR